MKLLKEEFTFLSDDLSFNEIDYSIISIIKTDHTRSIRELSKKLDKNISTIHYVKKLEKQGIMEFIKGSKNNNILICNFDAINNEF